MKGPRRARMRVYRAGKKCLGYAPQAPGNSRCAPIAPRNFHCTPTPFNKSDADK